MKRKYFDLQLFEEDGEGNPGQGAGAGTGNGGQNHAGATYSYEQAEQIAQARADRASKSALANYFRQQGMTESEITAAINDFKAKKAASAPDVAAITKERDDARQEVEQLKNTEFLRSKGIAQEDMDYVAFKVSQKVDSKTDFKKAAEAFLKENPKFTGQGSYRVSTGAPSGGSGSAQTPNENINSSIRRAFGR